MKNSIIILLLLALICLHATQARKSFTKEEGDEEAADADGPARKPLVNLAGADEESETESEQDSVPLLVVSSTQDQTLNPKEVESTIPCEIKQGYLVQVTKVDIPAKIKASDELPTQILHGRPVFVVLNKHTLSFFENENVNSLISSMNVRTLGLPAFIANFDQYNCFQLNESPSASNSNEGEKSFTIERFDQNAKATFCASTSQKMEEWAQAIIDFDNCELEIIPPAENLTLTEILDKKDEQLVEESQEAKAECTAEHAEEQSINEKLEEQNEAEKAEFENTVKDLETIITKSQQISMKTKLESEEQQRKLAEQTEVLQKEKICLEKMLMAKAQAEEAQTEMLIKDEQAESEKNIFERTTEMFKNAKEEEAHKLVEQQQQLREEEEARQAQLKQDMVTETLRAELDQNYDACFADELGLDFVNYSKKTCYEMSKAEGSFNGDEAKILSNCLSQDSFCQTCCNFHIGLIHVQKRNSCATECNDKLHSGEEDTGIKTTADAINVRIPRSASLTAEEPTEAEMRFRQISHMRFRQLGSDDIKDQIAHEKNQAKKDNNAEHRAFNSKNLQTWRDNLQADKQRAVNKRFNHIKARLSNNRR